MKIALCLSGLTGGSGGKDGVGNSLDIDIPYQSVKKYLLDVNDIDVFIHSWSKEFEKELIDLYKPKKQKFEKQIIFDKDNHRKHITQSRFYGNNKVLDLKRLYEEENNFIYDVVMISRLDLVWFNEVNFDMYDPKYFYASHWNHNGPDQIGPYGMENFNIGSGFLDFWFFSNSKIMNTFGNLCDVDKINHLISIGVPLSGHALTYKIASLCNADIKYTKYRGYDHEVYRRVIRKGWTND
jgi:hypothetical protein